MIFLFVIGTIAGIMLGLRFKVLVLVPAILLATIFIIASGSGHELKMITLSLMGTVVLLQIGYFMGSMLRALIRAQLLARRSAHLPPPGSQTGH